MGDIDANEVLARIWRESDEDPALALHNLATKLAEVEKERDEFKRQTGALGSRLMYERDTALSSLAAVTAECNEYHEMLRSILAECDDSARASIGSDAPLRAVKRLKADRDSYARSDFERQLDEARADNERLRGEVERMRPVYEAAVRAVDNADRVRCAIWLDSSTGHAFDRAVLDADTTKGTGE